MYVCLCRGVTDSAIRSAVEAGVSCYRELSLTTGCGTQCGTCVDLSKSLLHAALEIKRTESAQSPPLMQVCPAA